MTIYADVEAYGAKAAERMQLFVQAHLAIKDVDIKALIEEGRD